MIWLGSVAIVELARIVRRLEWREMVQPPYRGAAIALAFLIPVAALAVEMPGHVSMIARGNSMDYTPEWEAVKIMRAHAKETRWVFSPSGLFPFYAGLLVPPETAVLSMKRFRSGQITSDKLVEMLERYQPEQVVLKDSWNDKKVSEWVRERYQLVFEKGGIRLFLAQRLVSRSTASTEAP
ncbi:MAG: hypothetical protein HY300_17160 [Verrucomicrobia bacterium]|nr:hypothetical protein [Verrucomicrobiota bacterium]